MADATMELADATKETTKPFYLQSNYVISLSALWLTYTMQPGAYIVSAAGTITHTHTHTYTHYTLWAPDATDAIVV